MRRIFIALTLGVALSTSLAATDLYRVKVDNQASAKLLEEMQVDPVLRLPDGYLILADEMQGRALMHSIIDYKLIEANIRRDEIAFGMDRVVSTSNLSPFFKENHLGLYRIGIDQLHKSPELAGFIPVLDRQSKIEYKAPLQFDKSGFSLDKNIDSLAALISQDSVDSYLHRLEAFTHRLTGTDSNYAARDWLYEKFESFGYDSIYIDPLIGSQLWERIPVQSYNVIATKVGTVYPEKQIIVGSHMDAVPDCPGADDNGTGTCGVLEIARILADVETEMTFIFIPFDSEESWMWGSYHYADAAAARGDEIVYMINLDMIGHISNSNQANLYYGPLSAYAELWKAIAEPMVDISAVMAGQTASDHLPFIDNGYDVTFVQEYDFSTEYHQPSDSTTYINFEYMTRMIQASLATVLTVDVTPPVVHLESVRDAGTGDQLLVSWLEYTYPGLSHFIVYYDTKPETGLNSVLVSGGETSVMLDGLTEGQLYQVHVIAVNELGHRSIAYEEDQGRPNYFPSAPEGFVALPGYRAIHLSWLANNTELDFAHYTLIRDGNIMPFVITGESYTDSDFELGYDLHSYLVVAVDNEGNISDTVGTAPMVTRAASLLPGRVLAVNRSADATPQIVDASVTGNFLNDALAGYDYDYYSDSAYGNYQKIELSDMLDYELLVLGGESGRTDDFGNAATFGGILDSLAHYMSIGGKVIIFGRWGNLRTGAAIADTIIFTPGAYDYGYESFFHIDHRVNFLSDWTSTVLSSDLIGSHSLAAGYPDLVWDSLATVSHSFPWIEASGIPCPSFPVFIGDSQADPIYSYDSRSDFPFTEERVTGWRYFGSDYQYIFFEIPLSFMERSSSKLALQKAISELLTSGLAGSTLITPDTLDLTGSYPSSISIYLGDFSDGQIASDVDLASLTVNGLVTPTSSTVELSYPMFVGEVLRLDMDTDQFSDSYTGLTDTSQRIYTVSWQYNGVSQTHIIDGIVTFIASSFVAGDANGDYNVNVGDAVFLISFVFKDGPAPDPYEAGDANCDGGVSIGDAVFIVNFVFKNGPQPNCY